MTDLNAAVIAAIDAEREARRVVPGEADTLAGRRAALARVRAAAVVVDAAVAAVEAGD